MISFLKNFPIEIQEKIIQNNLEGLEEIRIRTLQPIILKFSNHETIIGYTPTQKEILQILQLLCDNSIYSYQNQICNRLYYNLRWT